MKTKTKLFLACLLGSVFLSMVSAESPSDPGEAMRQRITAKAERVQEGAQTLAANGTDPSFIRQAMEETVKPLLATGKFDEAEKELDRVLEQLPPGKPTPAPKERPQVPILPTATGGANDANDIAYLVFMPPLPGTGSTPESFVAAIRDFAAKLGTTGDAKTRQLGSGFGFPVFARSEAAIREAIKHGFDFARQTNVAIQLVVDDHAKWDDRPDLWNWYDPAKKGYNPDNRKNVEWFDWEGTPSKRRYLSPDGAPRLAPHMCPNSPAVLKEVSRIISQVVGPALREELDELKREHKEYLFSGITVGSEAGFDDYSVVPTIAQIESQLQQTKDPMRAQMMRMFLMAAKPMEEDNAPHSRVGYCALTNAGYSKTNPPADINAALAAINHQVIEFWDKQFVDAGIPRSRLYTHVAFAGPDASTNAPNGIVFNSYARPGWTTYPGGALKNGLQPLYDELAKHGNPTWGSVEANAFGNPNAPQRASWETYLAWHYNHGAKLVAMNVGATDAWVMSHLSKGTYGDEAMAAYRKFLNGEQLVEK